MWDTGGVRRAVADGVCEMGCVFSVCVEGVRLTGCGVIVECVCGTLAVLASGRVRGLEAAGCM